MGKSIFIIEDDANFLSGLTAKFRVAGFSVEQNNGNEEETEVLQKIKSIRPDYIILDLILPKIDGFELLQQIKADDEIANTPVFIFTSLSDNDSRARGDRLGANFYFIKNDFNIDSFTEKVVNIINNVRK